MSKAGKHNFFFNDKGIQGHASFSGKPDEKTLDALFKMVEIAHSKKLPNGNTKKNKALGS